MPVGAPASQFGSSFSHGGQTHSSWVGIGRDADAVVFYFKGEAVVRADHPDCDALRTGVLLESYFGDSRVSISWGETRHFFDEFRARTGLTT
jgi:hypothetical protein